MERTHLVEKLIATWNEDFPEYPLKAQNLMEPHALMGALFLIIERLGIDKEAVLAPPPEENCNKHLSYYWDLLPVINMTRVVNHLVSVMPQQVSASINITHFLQPNFKTSHSVLLLLVNLMLFNEQRLKDIAPNEEELFAKTDQVKALIDKKNELIEMLNEQAVQKGKRAGRLEKLENDKIRYEEELEQERNLNNQERNEWEALVRETEQNAKLLQQKRAVREKQLPEMAHWKALRVYDVSDVNAQALQAAKDMKEAEEKINSTRATLMVKESSVKNLQTIKPALDNACEEMHEIKELLENLNEYKCDDAEGEDMSRSLEASRVELGEARAAGEVARRRWGEAARAARHARQDRLHRAAQLTSAISDAEEKEERCRKRSEKALQTIEEIKQSTIKYKEEKAMGMEQLANLKTTFINELKSVEGTLINKTLDVEKRLRNKIAECQTIKSI